MRPLRMGILDRVSPSYFPAVATVELGALAQQGVDATQELIFPPDKAYAALKEGSFDVIAGPAHSALRVFPGWQGARILCAQSQNMYWFLVVRPDVQVEAADLTGLKGLRIGAAPGPDYGFRQLLVAAGVDARACNIKIEPMPGSFEDGVNFGLLAVRALEGGLIDGFWANGMAAKLATERKIGKVVIDARRGGGPSGAVGYTFPGVITSTAVLQDRPQLPAQMFAAMKATHARLRTNPRCAEQAANPFFPRAELALIATLIERDLPFYDPIVRRETYASMNGFARAQGLLNEVDVLPYEEAVAHPARA